MTADAPPALHLSVAARETKWIAEFVGVQALVIHGPHDTEVIFNVATDCRLLARRTAQCTWEVKLWHFGKKRRVKVIDMVLQGTSTVQLRLKPNPHPYTRTLMYDSTTRRRGL